MAAAAEADLSGQLRLDLPTVRQSFTREALRIAESNEAAVAVVDAFMASSEPALAICGPAGSGKSHLAAILAAENGVAPYPAVDLEAVASSKAALVVLDRAERAGDPAALLALVEGRRSRGLKLVLAGRGRPRDWANGLKDLETRLEAMARARLDEPDEALLKVVLARGFEDRQWRFDPKVIDYAAPRIPRTFAAAQAFVEAAGEAAIAGEKRISLTVARKVIANLFEAQPAA